MTYAKVENGVVVNRNYTLTELRMANPNISIPQTPTADQLISLGIYSVVYDNAPTYDQFQQKLVIESSVVGDIVRVSYTVVPLNVEELVQAVDLKMEYAKRVRAYAVDQIKVTAASGKVFDGDEVSQSRMARAIISLQGSSQTETLWILADNTPTQVSVAELIEALSLSGIEQTRLWAAPYA